MRAMKSIILIGFMGAGKSSLAPLLAKRWQWRCVDTDLFIEQRFRKSIGALFSLWGQEVFRLRERMVLEELSGMSELVLSTGGGLPAYSDNMKLLKEMGLVVYLDYPEEVLVERLRYRRANRPLIRELGEAELRSFISKALEGRRPFYEKAHIQLRLEGQETLEETLSLLLEAVAVYECAGSC